MGRKLNLLATIVAFLSFSVFAQAQDEASATSLYNDGLAKLKAKEYNEALTLLEQAIEKADPESDEKVIKLAKRNSAFACYYIGTQLRKEKKYDEALNTFAKGIDYSKAVYSCFIGRAQALEGKGDKAEAVKAYLTAAEMTKQAGKEERAAKLVSKAENFAGVAYGKKKYDEAIATGQQYLELSGPSADVHYYVAQALLKKGKKQEALEHANKALENAGDDKNKYYFGQAEILESLGQKAKAVEAYKMVGGEKYGERAKYKVDQLGSGK